MFKNGEDSSKKYSEMKDDYNKLKSRHCSPPGMQSKTRLKISKALSSSDFYNEIEKIVLGISNAGTDFLKIF